ncbi:hypothetical protein O6H91_20G004700 [Diphasiastrum complanatum]|uniref:Uncharacterized protein n=1 Tax=Diphasiastrum complanatum TaxID=34168 RepID=A0ACC2AMC9_DIPCM|nr:hypothetical protein O6H91_20G004700 [Diphasiastrum complanatum]
MEELKQNHADILEDLQLYGVGPDWNTSDERHRATLLSLQISPSLASVSAVVQPSEQKEDATHKLSIESSPIRLDMMDRSFPDSIPSDGARYGRGLSVRFADGDDQFSEITSSTTPLKKLASQFHARPANGSRSPTSSTLQSRGAFPSAAPSQTPPVLERDFGTDLATAKGYLKARLSPKKSRVINRDRNETVALPRSHAESGSFLFPLDIRTELRSKRSSEEDNRQQNLEASTEKEISDMKAAPYSRFYSAPLPFKSQKGHPSARNLRSDVLPAAGSWNKTSGKGEEYEMFRTRSGRFNSTLQKQFSRMQSRLQGKETQTPGKSRRTSQTTPSKLQSLPARRYFAALQGPELENLKDSEDILLPLDEQWPFLLRFPISSFGISLGLGSQAILWKTLVLTSSVHLLHILRVINMVLWCLTLIALIVLFSVYMLKWFFYSEAVHREFHHPVRVNFFFAPWIAAMFLAIGVPPVIATTIHPAIWCVFMAPIFLLELKIYGQWLSGGERRLSKVANPSTHLSVVGNFVGAILGAIVGWKEAATFFWSVGLGHYLVVFVTLYQRLPTNETLPKELHPVFFLFVAAPSAASVAWENIVGDFDHVSQIVYFVSIFLFASLQVVRLNFFRGFRFSIAWWAYTFPMTSASIATIRYSQKVRSHITKVMAIALTLISSTMVLLLFISTVFHIWSGNLFPNDMAIAITARKRKAVKKGLKKDDNSSSQNGIFSQENNNAEFVGDEIPKLLQQCMSFSGSDNEMANEAVNLKHTKLNGSRIHESSP